MSSLPKELQSAYQRWELASLGDDSARTRTPGAGSVQSEVQLAAARERARQEGYAEGLEQGRRAGLEQARAVVAGEALQFQQMASAFSGELASAHEDIARDLLNLALDLSKAMLKTALAVRPELMLPVVSDAVHYLPGLQLPATLHLQPEDAALVRARMGDELTNAGWRIVDDPQLGRGGCRLQTANSQIDATVETRWQRIAAALGKEADWLA
jgi:flagellar assembly protein FliH